jgi:hypothetical protein
MAVIRSRDEGSLTTGGGGFQTTPLPERSIAGLDIDLAREAGAAQVKDDVLVDTPPPGRIAVTAKATRPDPITSSATARSMSAAATLARKRPIWA